MRAVRLVPVLVASVLAMLQPWVSRAGQTESLRAGPAYPAPGPRLSVVVEPHLAGGSTRVDAGDFALLEVKKEIASGAAVREFNEVKDGDTCAGIAVMSILDVSGSMKGRPIEMIRRGLADSVSRMRDCDRVAIGTVADEVRWEVDWATAQERVRSSIERLETRGRLTRLYDAVLASLDKFESARDLPARRRLFVISDGEDEGSRATIEDVTRRANQLRISIDTIGVASRDPAHLSSLRQMSDASGGLYREAQDAAKLQSLVSSGVERLLKTPVVEFDSDALPEDGRQHSYVVRWKSRGLEDSVEVAFAEPQSFSLARWQWVLIVVLLVAAIFFIRDLTSKGAGRGRPTRPGETTRRATPPRSRKIVERTPTAHKVDGGDGDSAPDGQRETVFENLSAQGTPASSKYKAAEPVPRAQPSHDRGPSGADAASAAAPARTDRATRLGVTFQPGPSGIVATLLVSEGPLTGHRFPIPAAGDYWIGAAADNALVLPDTAVSGNHAMLRYESGYLRIQDNRSRNGTWVNDRNIGATPYLLSPWDRLRVGRSVLTLEALSQ